MQTIIRNVSKRSKADAVRMMYYGVADKRKAQEIALQ